MEEVLSVFLTVVMIICCCLIFLALFKAVKGPTIADRLVAVNMIGTQTIIIIAVLAVKMNEGWLADVAIIYALISFVAIVVFSKIYIGEYKEKSRENNMDDSVKKNLIPDDDDDETENYGEKLGAPEKGEVKPFIAGEINIPRTRDGKPLPELTKEDEEGGTENE